MLARNISGQQTGQSSVQLKPDPDHYHDGWYLTGDIGKPGFVTIEEAFLNENPSYEPLFVVEIKAWFCYN